LRWRKLINNLGEPIAAWLTQSELLMAGENAAILYIPAANTDMVETFEVASKIFGLLKNTFPKLETFKITSNPVYDIVAGDQAIILKVQNHNDKSRQI